MQHRLFIKFAVAILFLCVSGASQALAQDSKTPDITKAVFWSDAGSGIQVYLVPKNHHYRLVVVSKGDVKVTYHTSINSVEPVMKELAPVETSGETVRYYEFQHSFSKMTIWMGLSFTLDGQKVPNLTRTFYNDIFTLVPENFFGGPRKGKS